MKRSYTYMKAGSRTLFLALVFVYGLGSVFCDLQAQDIHFSQFNFSPLNQNPANTNLFDGDFRFVGNYRNQWPSVPVRYNTFSASAEMNFATLKNGDRIGGGLVFFFDRAGDSRFTSLNTALSVSYTKMLDKKNHHALSGGMQFGLVNRNINYSKLNFDNQWNGDVFDPNIGVDETFARTRFNYFDLGVGLAYRYTKTERTNFTVGFGATHLTQPKQTFYNDNSVKLNPRFTVHTRAQAKVAKRVDIVPEVQFQMQDSKYEVGYGAHVKYYVAMKSLHTIALNLGAYGRSAEAGWLFAGMDYDNLQVNLSYDVNFSKLRAASRYNGGFEVSVIYILAKVKKINKPGAVCPAFL
ncbi:MAG TPA: PorP/SprF family type IX secretion system membrane protein [Chitinophagales bacterium]|nr:PorP/SprF family type IX secretion system membrane protein [Chitinophagales bacterium]